MIIIKEMIFGKKYSIWNKFLWNIWIWNLKFFNLLGKRDTVLVRNVNVLNFLGLVIISFFSNSSILLFCRLCIRKFLFLRTLTSSIYLFWQWMENRVICWLHYSTDFTFIFHFFIATAEKGIQRDVLKGSDRNFLLHIELIEEL